MAAMGYSRKGSLDVEVEDDNHITTLGEEKTVASSFGVGNDRGGQKRGSRPFSNNSCSKRSGTSGKDKFCKDQ